MLATEQGRRKVGKIGKWERGGGRRGEFCAFVLTDLHFPFLYRTKQRDTLAKTYAGP